MPTSINLRRMCEPKQCCAPMPSGQRCPNLTIDSGKLHCQNHYTKALALYTDYKHKCELSDQINLEEVENFPDQDQKIAFLHKCYCQYVAAYNGRMKHRDYAFVPECHDYGHNLQFDIIQKKIDQCELQLCQLYQDIIAEKHKHQKQPTGEPKLEPEVEVEPEPEGKIGEIINSVRNFKKKRLNKDKEVNRIIEKYRQENQIILNKKRKLITQCLDKLYELVDYQNNRLATIGAYHLVIGLYQSDFFNRRPDKCQCGCGGYERFPVHLGCKCPLKYDTAIDYLLDRPCNPFQIVIDSLNHRQHHGDICDVMVDFCDHYDRVGNDFIHKHYVISWSQTLNRLTLVEDTDLPAKMPRAKKRR